MKKFVFHVVLILFDLVCRLVCAKYFQCESCREVLNDYYEHCFDESLDFLSED